jgi:hypothetical protein
MKTKARNLPHRVESGDLNFADLAKEWRECPNAHAFTEKYRTTTPTCERLFGRRPNKDDRIGSRGVPDKRLGERAADLLRLRDLKVQAEIDSKDSAAVYADEDMGEIVTDLKSI